MLLLSNSYQIKYEPQLFDKHLLWLGVKKTLIVIKIYIIIKIFEQMAFSGSVGHQNKLLK